MKTRDIKLTLGFYLLAVAALTIPASQAAQQAAVKQTENRIELDALGGQLEVGDVVFIRIPNRLFTKVADTTQSWTNHVGIVTDVSGEEPQISESRFPLSGSTTWSRFVARSEHERVAVGRLHKAQDHQKHRKIAKAAAARTGILYDTGFDLHSRRQFCSRFVREVLDEATGVRLGQAENFSALLANNPEADLAFWRMWYFGYIPWQRETVTPASLLNDAQLHIIFDGYTGTTNSNKGD